jgi:hypothetical protein
MRTTNLEAQMKKLMMAALVCTFWATVGRAQDTPKADVAAGFSSVYVVKGFTFFMNGGSASVALNVNNSLGVVGDFGTYHANPGVSLTTETYTVGPRFSYRRLGRLVPFAQVLAGGLHASALTTGFTNASNTFAFAAGAGADLGLDSGERFALRPQVEYFGFRAKGSTTSNVRISFGIVFRIGKKS